MKSENTYMMHPILLHYYITNRCNSKCRFCSLWSELPKKDAVKEEVISNLAYARKNGCRFVDFTGGEPLLHPDLPEFLASAKKIGFITSVTTNCLLFPQRISELAGKIDLLHFSLDADNADQHNSIRGSVSFQKVLESIPLALKNDLIPDLLFTYTNDNIDSFEGVATLGHNYKLMTILDPVFSTTTSDTVSPKTHSKALLYAKKPGVYLNKAHITLRRNGGNHIRNALCRAVQSTIVLTPDNCRVLPCYHHRTISLPITSIHEFSIKKSIDVIDAFHKQGTYSFCEGCHINCYFDPTYNYLFNRLFFQSLTSKFAYIIMKYLVYGHFRAFLHIY